MFLLCCIKRCLPSNSNVLEIGTGPRTDWKILQPNGIICHSFWRGEGSEIFKGLFDNYHDEENPVNFYKEFFEVVLAQRYQEF